MENATLRAATASELPAIWDIVQQAIEQRRRDGSTQWQNGYPNERTIRDDIAQGYAHVLVEDDEILAYAAVLFGADPAYASIDGRWLTDGPYAAVHRLARPDAAKSKGAATRLLQRLEASCLDKGIRSIRLDTNFDNAPMLHILAKLGYVYCG
ncbi:MAG: GNAT family N-acetyltransferase [Lysobacteraceae bacterium]